MKVQQYYALSLLISLGFIWGSGYTLARYAISAGVSPLGYSFWQTFGPFLLLSLCKKLFPNNDSDSKTVNQSLTKKWQIYFYYCVTGLFGIALPNTNMYIQAQHIPASLMAVLVNTVPLFTYVLTLCLNKKKFSWLQSLAVCLGMIGIVLILNKSVTHHEWQYRWLWILITPLSFACSALFIEHLCHDIPILPLACGMLGSASALLFIIVIQANAFYQFSWPLHLKDIAVLTEIFLSSLGYLIFFELLKVSNALYYSLVGGMVTITGLFWGHYLLSETLHFKQTLGTIIVITAIIMMTTYQGSEHAR